MFFSSMSSRDSLCYWFSTLLTFPIALAGLFSFGGVFLISRNPIPFSSGGDKMILFAGIVLGTWALSALPPRGRLWPCVPWQHALWFLFLTVLCVLPGELLVVYVLPEMGGQFTLTWCLTILCGYFLEASVAPIIPTFLVALNSMTGELPYLFFVGSVDSWFTLVFAVLIFALTIYTVSFPNPFRRRCGLSPDK